MWDPQAPLQPAWSLEAPAAVQLEASRVFVVMVSLYRPRPLGRDQEAAGTSTGAANEAVA